MKMPTWLKILIPVFLLAVLLTALLGMFLFEEPPAYADTAAIEARFGAQLAELEAMASDLPFEGCAGLASVEGGLNEALAQVGKWRERVDEGRALFDEPVILGAEVVRDCDDSSQTFGVKPYHEWKALSRAMWLPPTEWPTVNISYVGRQRVIHYENRFEDESGTVTKTHLILDLAGLGEE